MPNIHVLDQNTINKIAAGEVIERPASVVKELLENAIDARATAVTVEIRDGGISFIRVTDNGCGIPKEELPLAFLRHSTSKIQSVEDLFTVASLGFRGEALSSIAAVAQVEVISKTPDSLTGTRYQIEGGVERGIEEIGAPEGTTFLARNLFYNTPVRKKFLKTAATEGAHVADLVEKIALSHPEVSIRLIQNHQNKLHTSGNHNVRDIIYTIFGREIAANLLPVSKSGEMISVSGFIGKPVIARNNRNFEQYFINGRYIKSSIVSKAIEEAYRPFMMQHKYPFTLLHFTIEPEFLDVNVHPTKMELRFRDGELMFELVRAAISDALLQKELIPSVSLDGGKPKSGVRSDGVRSDEERELAGVGQEKPQKSKRLPVPEPFERRRMEQMSESKESSGKGSSGCVREETAVYGAGTSAGTFPAIPSGLRPARETEAAGTEPTVASQAVLPPETPAPAPDAESRQLDLFEEKLLEPKARSRHKLIGQLFDTYWMVEFNDQLYIIDQHAAHEKVLYEQTMNSLKTREHTSQALNPPIILTLGSSECVMMETYMDQFRKIGFEIEPFGGREYAVRGVPDNLFSIAKKELLMEMIDGLTENISVKNPDIIYEKVASMSCKAAVKGNHAMSQTEADRLIDQLLNLENPYACPHGRPTIISMSKYELEKKFKRIV